MSGWSGATEDNGCPLLNAFADDGDRAGSGVATRVRRREMEEQRRVLRRGLARHARTQKENSEL